MDSPSAEMDDNDGFGNDGTAGDTTNVTVDQLDASNRFLLGNIERLIDDKLSTHKEVTERHKFTFKKRGKYTNSSSSMPLASITNIAKRAHQEIDSALDEISHGNKMLKLADTSDGGWGRTKIRTSAVF